MANIIIDYRVKKIFLNYKISSISYEDFLLFISYKFEIGVMLDKSYRYLCNNYRNIYNMLSEKEILEVKILNASLYKILTSIIENGVECIIRYEYENVVSTKVIAL